MTIANINIREVLLKRGNTAVSADYVGPLGEVTVDTGLKALRIHDGITPGGNLIALTGSTTSGSTDRLTSGNAELVLENDGIITSVMFPARGTGKIGISGSEISTTPAGEGNYSAPLVLSSFSNDVWISANGIGPRPKWEFKTNGTLNVPVPQGGLFTLTLSSANFIPREGKTTLTLSGAPWVLQGQIQRNADGSAELQLNQIFPQIDNPGYVSGDTFTFDDQVHHLFGFDLEIGLADVVQAGPAGWTANLQANQLPDYPSTVNSDGAIKLTSNENSWVFDAFGTLHLPPEGDILDSNGNSVLGGDEFSGDYNDLTNKPAAQILQAPQWNTLHNLGTGNRYLIGDLVFDSGNIYQAIADSESQYTAVGDPTYWRNLGAGIRLQTDYLDLANKPSIPTDLADLTDNNNLITSGATGPQGPIGPQGPQGDTGATGPAGADGATGPQGDIGADGATGPQGDIGADGATGPQGATGDTGATGLAGTNGIDGATGPQGVTGDTGATGLAGTDGATGPQGVQGQTGDTGPQGATGAIGNTGATGPQGVSVTLVGSTATNAGLPVTGNPGDGWIVTDTGDLWFWSTVASQWENIGKIVGPQGGPGPIGASGLQGATGIAVSKFAIYGQRSTNITANSYFGFGNGSNSLGSGVTLPENVTLIALTVDANTAYTASVSIEVLKNTVATGQFANVAIGSTNTVADNLNYSFNKGDTLSFVTRTGAGGTETVVTAWFTTITGTVAYSTDGATGATGPQGATGNIGLTGDTGATGPQGATGLQGLTGPSGPQGSIGLAGADGVDGVTGPQGATGSTGSTGASGATGPQGATGANGLGTTTGSWTLAPGANTVSLTVTPNRTYSMWVNGNIPNGIVMWNATVSLANTNVPAVGSQYAWYYAAGSALVFTSIPNHIVGTAGGISTNSVATGTSNVFTFGITNNSVSNQTVNWGYVEL